MQGPAALCFASVEGKSQMITGGVDTEVRMSDAQTESRTLVEDLPEGVRCLAADPAAARFAVGLDNGLVKVYALPTGDEACTEAFTVTQNTLAVHDLAFNPNGTQIAWCHAVAGNDAEVKLIDVTADSAAESVTQLEGHEGPVLGVSYDPQGKYLATTGSDGFVKVFDLASKAEVASMRCRDKLPADTDDTAKTLKATFEPTSGKSLALPGGARVRLVERDAWDVDAATLLGEEGVGGAGFTVAAAYFSPSGEHVASIDAVPAGIDDAVGSVVVFDVATRKLVHRVGSEASFFQAAAWSPAANKEEKKEEENKFDLGVVDAQGQPQILKDVLNQSGNAEKPAEAEAEAEAEKEEAKEEAKEDDKADVEDAASAEKEKEEAPAEKEPEAKPEAKADMEVEQEVEKEAGAAPVAGDAAKAAPAEAEQEDMFGGDDDLFANFDMDSAIAQAEPAAAAPAPAAPAAAEEKPAAAAEEKPAAETAAEEPTAMEDITDTAAAETPADAAPAAVAAEADDDNSSSSSSSSSSSAKKKSKKDKKDKKRKRLKRLSKGGGSDDDDDDAGMLESDDADAAKNGRNDDDDDKEEEEEEEEQEEGQDGEGKKSSKKQKKAKKAKASESSSSSSSSSLVDDEAGEAGKDDGDIDDEEEGGEVSLSDMKKQMMEPSGKAADAADAAGDDDGDGGGGEVRPAEYKALQAQLALAEERRKREASTLVMQEPFVPGSTPAPASGPGAAAKRRFLVWNMSGSIVTREDQTGLSAVEVEFSGEGRRRTVRIADHYGYSMGALSAAGFFLASEATTLTDPERGKRKRVPSTVCCRPLRPLGTAGSAGADAEWMQELPLGEEVVSVAMGDTWAAAVTDRRYLRLFTATSGLEAPPVMLPGPPVALAGHGRFLVVAYHAGPPFAGAQQLEYRLMAVRPDGVGCETLASGWLPMGAKARTDEEGQEEAAAQVEEAEAALGLGGAGGMVGDDADLADEGAAAAARKAATAAAKKRLAARGVHLQWLGVNEQGMAVAVDTSGQAIALLPESASGHGASDKDAELALAKADLSKMQRSQAGRGGMGGGMGVSEEEYVEAAIRRRRAALGLARPQGGAAWGWVPVLDLKSLLRSGGEREAYWPLALQGTDLMAVHVKGPVGRQFPATVPRPIISKLALQVPLLSVHEAIEANKAKEKAEAKKAARKGGASKAKTVGAGLVPPGAPAAVEAAYLRGRMAADVMRWRLGDERLGTVVTPGRGEEYAAEEDAALVTLHKAQMELDKVLLKRIKAVCADGESGRAADLVSRLQNPKSLEIAIKIARAARLDQLADHIDFRKGQVQLRSEAVQRAVQPPKPVHTTTTKVIERVVHVPAAAPAGAAASAAAAAAAAAADADADADADAGGDVVPLAQPQSQPAAASKTETGAADASAAAAAAVSDDDEAGATNNDNDDDGGASAEDGDGGAGSSTPQVDASSSLKTPSARDKSSARNAGKGATSTGRKSSSGSANPFKKNTVASPMKSRSRGARRSRSSSAGGSAFGGRPVDESPAKKPKAPMLGRQSSFVQGVHNKKVRADRSRKRGESSTTREKRAKHAEDSRA
eukprot:g3435.t1